MPHPLVEQLRFARAEFTRCLEGVSPEDAVKRFEPMNCISWMVGHIAIQERYYWVYLGQGRKEVGYDLLKSIGVERPATTPPLAEMWEQWEAVTSAADAYLDTITDETLLTFFEEKGRTFTENVGTLLHRNLYHYWFHTGEAHAIRQMLGHKDLPQFVGKIPHYRPSGE